MSITTNVQDFEQKELSPTETKSFFKASACIVVGTVSAAASVFSGLLSIRFFLNQFELPIIPSILKFLRNPSDSTNLELAGMSLQVIVGYGALYGVSGVIAYKTASIAKETFQLAYKHM